MKRHGNGKAQFRDQPPSALWPAAGLIALEDAAYAANRMLAQLHLREFTPQAVEEELPYPAEPLKALCEYAAQAGLIDPDTQDARDQFDTELMNCLMPRPSEVVKNL